MKIHNTSSTNLRLLRYINLTVADGQAVENALTHLGTCLYKDARERRTKAQYDQLIGEFIQTFHPFGKTKIQLLVMGELTVESTN